MGIDEQKERRRVWRARGEWWGLGEALGFPFYDGPAHHLCARPQVPFIVPLTEASAQLSSEVMLFFARSSGALHQVVDGHPIERV